MQQYVNTQISALDSVFYSVQDNLNDILAPTQSLDLNG